MAKKAGIFALWIAILIPVNAYLIRPEWGQLLFVGVSTGLMTYAQHRTDRHQDR